MFVVRFRFDESLAEDVKKDIDDDRITCQLVLRAIRNLCRLNLVDVCIVHTHQAKALTGCEFADAEFLPLQLGRERYLFLFLFHIFVF